jgi:hypothetical protein
LCILDLDLHMCTGRTPDWPRPSILVDGREEASRSKGRGDGRHNQAGHAPCARPPLDLWLLGTRRMVGNRARFLLALTALPGCFQLARLASKRSMINDQRSTTAPVIRVQPSKPSWWWWCSPAMRCMYSTYSHSRCAHGRRVASSTGSWEALSLCSVLHIAAAPCSPLLLSIDVQGHASSCPGQPPEGTSSE